MTTHTFQDIVNAWTPPKNFQFPTKKNFATSLAQGAGAIKPVVMSQVESFITPIKLQATGVIATVEAASGISLSEKGLQDISSLISAARAIGNAQTVSGTVRAVNEVINGTLGIATNVLKAVPDMASVLSFVPVVGASATAILSVVLQMVELFEATPEEKREACREQLREIMPEFCKAEYERQTVVGTGYKGNPLPSDLFRHYLYGIKAPTVASMYVGLCGDAVVKAKRYQPARKQVGTIKPEIRQMMWELIQGILAGVENPLAPPIGSDGGQGLFPALQGLVWNEYLNGTINDTAISDLATQVADETWRSKQCDVSAWNEPAKYETIRVGCGFVLAEALSNAFKQSISEVHTKFYKDPVYKYDPDKKIWDLKDVKLSSFKKPTGLITINAKMPALSTILNGSKPAKKTVFKDAVPPRTTAAAMAGPILLIAGSGGAAYWVAKKRRSSK